MHAIRPYRPQLDSLESRTVPATLFLDTDGTLIIQGTRYGDRIEVGYDEFGDVIVSDAGFETAVDGTEVTNIEFYGLGGHDFFQNDTDLESYADGGAGRDSLYGGSSDDYLFGGAGAFNDILDGWIGDDTLYGGAGHDVLIGDVGDDLIYGGAGHDDLYGDDGLDDLYGQGGHDYLDGGEDGLVDYLFGGAGWDTFVADWVQDDFGDWYNIDEPFDAHPYYDEII